MSNPTRRLVAAVGFVFMALSVTVAHSAPPSSVGALERGYRTGYSDGYQSGYGDSAQRAAKDYRNKADYQSADRAYANSYGALEDYRDGYQQGFEVGYDAGYERKGFDSTIPTNLSRRNTDDSQNSVGVSVQTNTGTSTSGGSMNTGNTANVTSIPANIVLRVELLTNLSTDVTQQGDRFQARVIEPTEFQDAMIEGHVTRVKRPGKVKGSAQLQLAFDKISLNGRWTEFRAQVIEVIDTGNSGDAGEADDEGGVKAKNRTKDDVAKVGASAGVGAIIGAIFGGGKGAAIGAAIGAGVGTGGVLTSSGKNIRLDHGQQLRIRTSSETQF
jgi:hypothetical protein